MKYIGVADLVYKTVLDVRVAVIQIWIKTSGDSHFFSGKLDLRAGSSFFLSGSSDLFFFLFLRGKPPGRRDLVRGIVGEIDRGPVKRVKSMEMYL